MAEIGTDIQKAAAILKAGGLVAIPTETVYGLAAKALDTGAVIKIFEAKNRPFFDPLIIHSNSLEKLHPYVLHIPEAAYKLAEAYWPGPLTLLLRKTVLVPDLVSSGLDTVAVRVPRHPLTLHLLEQLDFPLAAPSANPFGYVSPTQASHVIRQLGTKVNYVLDGGTCEVGIESTIVGFEDSGQVKVYRLGGLAVEDVEKIAGPVNVNLNQSSNPKAPGQLKSHYAPRKPLLLSTNIMESIRNFPGKKMALLAFSYAVKGIPAERTRILSATGDLQEAARNLFAALRELDDSDAELIIAEQLPSGFLGRAINDRLQRAAAAV